MSDASYGDGDAKRQQAFDTQAEELGFTLEERSFAEGEHHGIGIIPIPAVSRIVSTGTARVTTESEGESEGDDEAAVRAAIEAWERLHPDVVAEEGENLVTDPFLVVDDDRVETLDHHALKAAPATDEFRLVCERFPVKSIADGGRDVTISDCRIVFIGDGRAAATYHVKENYLKGDPFEGKAAAILLHTAQGWRITVMTKHRRVVPAS